MTPAKIPHLCGGILFGLLLEARKPRKKARNKLEGGTDGLKATDVYNGLIEVVTGESCSSAGNTNSKCTSNYKNCSSSKGVYVPFTEPATQSAFDEKYKRKDPDLYKRLSGFIDTYLNNDKCLWLVRALIDTMQQEQLDIEIAINYTEKLKISNLHTAKTIVFLPFLLSVIHYVVTKCPDCESGRPTFEDWYSQPSPRAEWKFKSKIGEHLSPIDIDFSLRFPNLESSALAQVDNTTTPISPASNTCSDRKVIARNVGKVLQPILDTLENQKTKLTCMEQMAKPLHALKSELESINYETVDKIQNNEQKVQVSAQKNLFDSFKDDCDRILQYCIKKDPAAEPISFSIPFQIEDLIDKWEFDIRKVNDPKEYKLIREVLQTLSEYTYYLSDEFLKEVDGDRLIFRNSSFEEGERLRNVLLPKSLELRNKIAELYRKLWPVPDVDLSVTENSEVTKSNADSCTTSSECQEADGSAIHQTIVNQYGDHPIHINHVNNLKL